MTDSLVFELLLCSAIFTYASGQCQRDWVHHGKSCYLFGKEHVTWAHAINTCKVYNATLAVITTVEEDTFLRNIVQHHGTTSSKRATEQNYWIDGSDYDTEGHWMWWSTKQAITYKNFYPGEPDDATGNEDCLELNTEHNGLWSDNNCYDQQLYICEKVLTNGVGTGGVVGR